MLSLLTCLVLHISLGSFGGRGEKFMDECLCVRVCVGGGDRLYPAAEVNGV